jgi:hypothetical protein
MKALKVFETYNFQRGFEPKRSLQIGKNQSPLYRALTDPNNQVDSEEFYEWMAENPLLAKDLKYDKDPLHLENYLAFDLDWYCEENNVDEDEIKKDFVSLDCIYDRRCFGTYGSKNTKTGQVRPKMGFIKSFPGSKVIYYYGAFITRKDWIGL